MKLYLTIAELYSIIKLSKGKKQKNGTYAPMGQKLPEMEELL